MISDTIAIMFKQYNKPIAQRPIIYIEIIVNRLQHILQDDILSMIH